MQESKPPSRSKGAVHRRLPVCPALNDVAAPRSVKKVPDHGHQTRDSGARSFPGRLVRSTGVSFFSIRLGNAAVQALRTIGARWKPLTLQSSGRLGESAATAARQLRRGRIRAGLHLRRSKWAAQRLQNRLRRRACADGGLGRRTRRRQRARSPHPPTRNRDGAACVALSLPPQGRGIHRPSLQNIVQPLRAALLLTPQACGQHLSFRGVLQATARRSIRNSVLRLYSPSRVNRLPGCTPCATSALGSPPGHGCGKGDAGGRDGAWRWWVQP
jgi:hypothetical protein